MNPPEPEDSLPRTLAGWQVTPLRNPQFRPGVWRRIAALRREPSWTAYARTHGATVAAALTVAVALGAWTGHERARDRDAAARSALVADYVHSLDARWMRLP